MSHASPKPRPGVPAGAIGVSDSGGDQGTIAGCDPQTLCHGASPTMRYDHTRAPSLRRNATIESQNAFGCSHDSEKKPFGAFLLHVATEAGSTYGWPKSP